MGERRARRSDGVGHVPWLENPAVFARVARDFVINTTIATADTDDKTD